jgi:hypothetical protein
VLDTALTTSPSSFPSDSKRLIGFNCLSSGKCFVRNCSSVSGDEGKSEKIFVSFVDTSASRSFSLSFKTHVGLLGFTGNCKREKGKCPQKKQGGSNHGPPDVVLGRDEERKK